MTRLRRSTQNRKRLSTHSHLRNSRDARSHGKHAGIAVYMPKGTTSKVTVETRSYGKKLFLWSNYSNFWVAPRTISTHSHLRNSRDARSHRKHAGIAVYMPKGTTSKVTVETRSYGKKLFLWSNSPDFGVAPRTCKLGTYSMLLWPCKKCSTNCYQWPISELLRFKRTV